MSCEDAQKDWQLKDRIEDDGREFSFVCDKDNDRGYYLLASEDPANRCWNRNGGPDFGMGCESFRMLPGTDKMGSSWGNITPKDVVLG